MERESDQSSYSLLFDGFFIQLDSVQSICKSTQEFLQQNNTLKPRHMERLSMFISLFQLWRLAIVFSSFFLCQRPWRILSCHFIQIRSFRIAKKKYEKFNPHQTIIMLLDINLCLCDALRCLNLDDYFIFFLFEYDSLLN